MNDIFPFPELSKIGIVGAPGTGKTTLACRIWRYIKKQDDNCPVIHGDHLRPQNLPKVLSIFNSFIVEHRLLFDVLHECPEIEIDLVIMLIAPVNECLQRTSSLKKPPYPDYDEYSRYLYSAAREFACKRANKLMVLSTHPNSTVPPILEKSDELSLFSDMVEVSKWISVHAQKYHYSLLQPFSSFSSGDTIHNS